MFGLCRYETYRITLDGIIFRKEAFRLNFGFQLLIQWLPSAISSHYPRKTIDYSPFLQVVVRLCEHWLTSDGDERPGESARGLQFVPLSFRW